MLGEIAFKARDKRNIRRQCKMKWLFVLGLATREAALPMGAIEPEVL